MPKHVFLWVSCLLLSACGKQQMADLVDRSNAYFGRSGWSENGQAIPRYSAQNPGNLEADVAYKYQSSTPQFGVDAAVDKVEAAELPAPAPVRAAVPTETESASLLSKAPSGTGGESLAFRWPVEGAVISRFGPKTDGLSNDGINIAAAEGDPIWAAADGEVAYVGQGLEGYGNLLILRHRGGWMSAYAHARDFQLQKGATVAQGDLLGHVGRTGSVKTPQLHFSLREGKTPIDPESVLSRSVAARGK